MWHTSAVRAGTYPLVHTRRFQRWVTRAIVELGVTVKTRIRLTVRRLLLIHVTDTTDLETRINHDATRYIAPRPTRDLIARGGKLG